MARRKTLTKTFTLCPHCIGTWQLYRDQPMYRTIPGFCHLCHLWGVVPIAVALEYGLMGLRTETLKVRFGVLRDERLEDLRQRHITRLALPAGPTASLDHG